MEDLKMFGRSCPKCGESYKDIEIAKAKLGPGVQINLMCEQSHKWSEFYTLFYQGYWWDGKKYDSYGKELIEVQDKEN